MTTDERLDGVDQRLGTLERRVNGVDQRLERVEGKQEAMLAWQQTHSERVALMDERFAQRFDDLEKVVIEIRDSLNGSR